MANEPRYLSNGKLVSPEPTQEDEEREKERYRQRVEEFPRNVRERELDRISEHRAKMTQKDPTKEHDGAVKYFDHAYQDLTCNPRVLNEVTRRHNLRAIQAAEKGEKVDWYTELPAIGEQLRKELGAPTSDERAHAEALELMKKSRGLE